MGEVRFGRKEESQTRRFKKIFGLKIYSQVIQSLGQFFMAS